MLWSYTVDFITGDLSVNQCGTEPCILKDRGLVFQLTVYVLSGKNLPNRISGRKLFALRFRIQT